MKCRCGWDGQGEHPCHGNNNTCRKPAKRRLYDARPVALAGVQMKFQASETFACDACWKAYQYFLGNKDKAGVAEQVDALDSKSGPKG